MQFTGKKRRSPPAVIIIALIDVLIVVLIFLVVTTTFKDQIPTLKITLPEAREVNRSGISTAKPIIVTITTNTPQLHLGNLPVTPERLENELKQAAKANPQVTLAIRADKEISLGMYVEVLDAARAANIGKENIVIYSREAIRPPP
jgi:biopolymer transport protein ExbD